MLRRLSYFLPALLLAVTPIVLAEVLEWKLDPAHSHVGFKIRHLMVSWVRGSFNIAEGTIWFDKDDLSTLRMEIAIDPASIDTGMRVRDRDLRGSEFFEVDKYPAMGFVSTKAIPQPDGTVKLTGHLTMHGVTKQVTLDVEGLTIVVQSDNGPRTGASATASLSRSDFGLTYNPILEAGGITVADEVFIEIDAEFKPPERP